jgi:hypothetical protein
VSLIPQLRALNKERVLSFIEELRLCGNMKMACEKSSLSREVVEVLYDRHPIFRKKFDYAIQDAADTLEGEAWRRAMYGYTKQLITKDGDVVDVTEHDNRLLFNMVKAAKKEKYSERVTHTGADGGAIQVEQHVINYDKLSEDDLKSLLTLIGKAQAGDAIDADYEEVDEQRAITQGA